MFFSHRYISILIKTDNSMNKLLLSRANSKELSGTITTVVDVVGKSAYEDKKLANLNTKLKKEGDDLTAAQNRKRKNDLTQVVDDLEKGRDKGFKALSFTTKGLTFRMDERLSGYAKLIYEVIKRHGLSLYKLPDIEQTAQMKSLSAELRKPENKAAMDATGLTIVFEEMNKLNKRYLDGLASLNDSKRKKAQEATKNVTEAGKKAKATLDAMIGYLNGCIEVDESIELKDLCENIGVIIDKANTNIHTRINRSKNDDDDETDELDFELEEDFG